MELSSKKCKLQMILEYVDNNGWMRFNMIIFLGPCKVLNVGISSRNCGWLMIVTEYDGLPSVKTNKLYPTFILYIWEWEVYKVLPKFVTNLVQSYQTLLNRGLKQTEKHNLVCTVQCHVTR